MSNGLINTPVAEWLENAVYVAVLVFVVAIIAAVFDDWHNRPRS